MYYFNGSNACACLTVTSSPLFSIHENNQFSVLVNYFPPVTIYHLSYYRGNTSGFVFMG